MKKILPNILKVIVSLVFLWLAIHKIDFRREGEILSRCYLPLIVIGFLLVLGITFLLTWRWLVLIKDHFPEDQDISFMQFWKMTMVGLFFNIFLPTGAGGDIAKIFYLVKDSEKKLILGSSVLVDRFIGALSVLSMAVVAILFTRGLGLKVYLTISGFFFLLCFLFIFLSQRRMASAWYQKVERLIPDRLDNWLRQLYEAFSFYCSRTKIFLSALGISYFLQIISIFSQYVFTRALFWGLPFPWSLRIFFIYIPLIWLASLIPSLGGLGIREFSYVFFFTPYLGKEQSMALSLLVLLTIILQAALGGLVFLTWSARKKQKEKFG